ncbi:hypothetical protein E3P77_01803 [Wallemia ichthyophaga]|nr:hypothetical protein E3P77_01803 [Wallemia ichthyophaga]
MVSLVTSIRDCERFRGEILKEISRKVDKIQDAGLTDYEVRDLNDEINGLLREKSNYERQIVSLGGANYRRAGVMLDESGKEIPGTRGYKYFGRAKDLPGVKELFERTDMDEEAEDDIYKPFTDQGPDYFGDTTEFNHELLEYEHDLEKKSHQNAVERLKVVLNTPDVQNEAYSHHKPRPLQALMEIAKENKLNSVHSDFIEDEYLEPPRLPTKEETDKALLDIRKQSLIHKQSAIHEAAVEDESIGGINDPGKREAAGERRRLIDIDPSSTLKANKKKLKEKVDAHKVDLLGKRKRKSKKWVRDVDPNVLIDDNAAENSNKLPSASVMKMIYSHTANYYKGKGILGEGSDNGSDNDSDETNNDIDIGSSNKDLNQGLIQDNNQSNDENNNHVDPTPVPRQDMSYAFDGTSLVCLGLLFEELIVHYTRDLIDEDIDVAREEPEDLSGLNDNTPQASENIIATNASTSHQINAKSKKKSTNKQSDQFIKQKALDDLSKKKVEPDSEDNLSLASDPDENALKSSPSIPSIRSPSIG